MTLLDFGRFIWKMKWLFVLPRQKLRGKLVAVMHQTHPDTNACLLGLLAAKCGSAHTAAGADTEEVAPQIPHVQKEIPPALPLPSPRPPVTKTGVPDEDVSVYSASPSPTCLLISHL